MHPWFRWINYLDPVAYAFEALLINEFHNRHFKCSSFVPQGLSYDNVTSDQRICSAVGAAAGADYVEGDAYINTSFNYYRSHLWRNLGILIGMTIALCAVYLVATEYISAQKSKGEVLLFRRGQVPDVKETEDEESKIDDRPTAEGIVAQKTTSEIPPSIQKQTAQFHWLGVNYDIKVKGGGRRLLDDVDGWVKPGTLTALSEYIMKRPLPDMSMHMAPLLWLGPYAIVSQTQFPPYSSMTDSRYLQWAPLAQAKPLF